MLFEREIALQQSGGGSLHNDGIIYSQDLGVDGRDSVLGLSGDKNELSG